MYFSTDDHLDHEDGPGAFDGLTAIEEVVRQGRALVAGQDALFHQVLTDAESDPVLWVGPDPTVDAAWEDPRGRTHTAVRRDRADLAVRAAAADLGARVHLSENQVRTRAYRAGVLAARCPRTWAACLFGAVSEQNMTTAAHLASSLPEDPDAWAAFDDAICHRAETLVPGRFRTAARTARERVHRESLPERHARAATDRYVRITPELDGMCAIEGVIPASGGIGIDRRLDDIARHLAADPDETRSHTQIRADALTDLLTGGNLAEHPDAHPADATGTGDPTVPDATTCGVSGIRATVRITIPALTLLGHSDEPATLDGYGPIPLDIARDLAAGATSWIRVLTHPVTGTVLDVDRHTYRIPADLKRWLQIRHHTCAFPGCTRPSDRCDNDHRIRWTDRGPTTAENLEPLCPNHHRLKDETQWQVHRHGATGSLTWTSPTGTTHDTDPPPF